MTRTDGASMKTARELAPLLKRIAPALVCAVALAVLTFLIMMAYHMPRPDPPAVLARSGEGSFEVYLAAWNAFQPRAYVMALVAGAAAFAICYRSARPRVVVGRVLDVCGGLCCALPIAIPLSDFGPSARVAGTISYLDFPQVYGPVAFAAVVAAIVFFSSLAAAMQAPADSRDRCCAGCANRSRSGSVWVALSLVQVPSPWDAPDSTPGSLAPWASSSGASRSW